MKTLMLVSFLVQGAGDYGIVREAAVNMDKPLVVGVGCEAPEGPWLTAQVESLIGFSGPCVVVSQPRGGDLFWLATLPATATVTDVKASLLPRTVRGQTSQPPAVGSTEWFRERRPPPSAFVSRKSC